MFKDLSLAPPDESMFAQLEPPPSQNKGEVSHVARLAVIAKAQGDPDLLISADQRQVEEEDDIHVFGTDKVMTDMAFREQQAKLSALTYTYRKAQQIGQADETFTNTIRNSMVTQNQIDYETRKDYALTVEAVKSARNALAAGDPDFAEMILRTDEEGDAYDIREAMITKRIILSGLIAKAEQEEEDRNALELVIDTLLGLVPVRYAAVRTGNVEKNNLGDNFLPGERLREDAKELFSLPLAEFVKRAPEVMGKIKDNTDLFFYRSKAGEANVARELLGTDVPEVWETNLNSFVDYATTLSGTKAGDLVFGVANKLGSRKGAAAVLAKMSQQNPNPNNLLPNSLTTGPQVSPVNHGPAASALIRAQNIFSTQTTRFHTKQELDAAFASTTKQLSEQLGPYSLLNTRRFSEKLADGSVVHEVVGLVGKSDGSGFVSKQQASTAATKAGFKGTPIVTDGNGSWFFASRVGVDETSFYTAPTTSSGAGSVLGRWFLGNRQLVSDLTFANSIQSGSKYQRVIKDISENLKTTWSKLGKEDVRKLDLVMLDGQLSKKWFDRVEFDAKYQTSFGRNALDKEWEAYSGYRSINDIEHAVRDATAYKMKAIAGYETVDMVGKGIRLADADVKVKTISTESLTGQQVFRLNPGDRVYDANNGILFNKQRPITQKDIDAYEKKGFILLETDDDALVAGVSNVRRILTKRSSVTRKQLKRNQIGYAAGGHRHYLGTHFAKQGRSKVLEDGSNIHLRPGTFVAGTQNQAKLWAESMNDIMSYIKTVTKVSGQRPTAQEIDATFHQLPIQVDGAEILRRIDDNTYNLDHPFEAVLDRQMPSMYTDRNIWAFDSDTDLGLSQNFGQMYNSGKGEVLKDWQGQFASTLNMSDSLNTALKNISRLSSFSDYKVSEVGRWVLNFQNYLDIAAETNRSPMFVFLNSKVRPDVERGLANRIESQRQAISRVLRLSSDTSLEEKYLQQKAIEWFAGDKVGLRDDLVNKAANWMRQTNPLAFIQGTAFNVKLGFFNPAQLFLQLSTTMAAAALKGDPELAVRAAVGYVPIRNYIFAKDKNQMLNYLTSKGVGEQLGFTDPNEFRSYLTNLDKSGILEISGNHQLIGEVGAEISYGAFSKVDKAVQASRFFFDTAEQANLSSAYRFAYDDIRKELPTLDWNSADFLRRVAGRTSDYAIGMQREASASWQQGLLSIPTQFWSYNARMLETLLGKQFTNEQKVRLAVSQFVLYGLGGVPVGYSINEYLKSQTGDAPDVGTLESLVTRGAVDNLIHLVSGGTVDVNVGSRMSSFSFVEKTLEALFGYGQFPSSSVGQTLGGASGSIWLQILDPAGDWIKYITIEAGAPDAEIQRNAAVINVARNISTVSSTLKAWSVYNYGTYISNKGNVLLSDLPSTEAFGVLLGFEPGKMNDLSAMMASQKDKKKAVAEASALLTSYRRRYLTEPENREQLRDEMNVLVKVLPPEIAEQARRRANVDDPSLFASVAESIEKDKQREQLKKDIANGELNN